MYSQDVLFSFYRGDDFAFKIEVKDASDVAVDLTGWTVTFTMKRNLNRDDSLADLQITKENLSDLDASNGLLVILLSSANTKTLNPGKYFFDIEVKTGSSTQTVLSGVNEVIADVTRGA
jgi:hypothetical protein